MIEMRWYVRNSNLDVSMDSIPEYAKEQVLQYRQKVDVTVRAGIWDADATARTANY
jgi:hypothetical protein